MTDIEMVELPDDHPGRADDAYRARRAAIAHAIDGLRPGDPIPYVEYTEEEDAVWRSVSTELAAKHRRYACRAYLQAGERLTLPADRVPQLREVDAHLRALTDFGLIPVAGLAPPRDFYAALARRTFMSTQYIRHHSAPYYTPEPDIVHEIIGHANMLADAPLADLYERAGRASTRVTTDAAHDFFSRVFWFTLEFGVLHQDGELKTYGAGLLSSFGEIDEFRAAHIEPWDIAAMGTLDYDITRYQPVLFAARSFDHMLDELASFFDGYDDDAYGRWSRAGASSGGRHQLAG